MLNVETELSQTCCESILGNLPGSAIVFSLSPTNRSQHGS